MLQKHQLNPMTSGRCSEPLQSPQIPQLELYSWDKVVSTKNSGYKKRPSRERVLPGQGEKRCRAARGTNGSPGTGSESQPCPLFYNKISTGRTGLCRTGELAGSVIRAICNTAISHWETFHFYSLPTERPSNTTTKKSEAMLFFPPPRAQAGNHGHGCSVHWATSAQLPR